MYYGQTCVSDVCIKLHGGGVLQVPVRNLKQEEVV